MLRTLLPLCDAVVTTRAQTPRALPPATLASLCHQLGYTGAVEIVGEARAALERARAPGRPRRRRAGDRLDLPHRRPAAPCRCGQEHPVMDEEDGPRVGVMIAIVAVSVALVILIFFGVGYGFGRLFL